MIDLPSWFNPDEYYSFLSESSDLVEMNIPYQKKKREIMMKRRRDARTEAIQQGRERAQEAHELAQAKAQGIMRGLGEEFKNKLMNTFFEKILEESNPIEQTKSKGRPEVDPSRRDRDRKRQERRKKKLSGLADVLIVRNKKNGKLEIITTEDHNPETHEVLKGKVGKIDKGPVAKSDLVSVSKKAEFMNTKTSMRILGKVKKEEETGPSERQASAESTEEVDTQQPTIPPPMPRVPRDGKEITDALSTYPDWDHQNSDVIVGIGYGLNRNQEMPPEISQKITQSRTLGDTINRAIAQLYEIVPGFANMQFQPLPTALPTSKAWSKIFNMPQASPVAIISGNNGQQTLGISIKVGEQIRPSSKGEAGFVFNTLIALDKEAQISKIFSMLLSDYFKELREVFMTKLPIMHNNQIDLKTGRAQIKQEKAEKQEYQDNKNIFVNRGKQLIEDLLNVSEEFKTQYLFECLTGNLKFDGGLGSANTMFTVNKDGSNVNVVELNYNFAKNLAETKETYLSVRFTQQEDCPFNQFYTQTVGKGESGSKIIPELEKLQELTNPVNFMQFLGLAISDIVFSVPLDYSDYHDNFGDTETVVTFNPGTKSEKELRVIVKKPVDTSGSEENFIEKGADHILEEYSMINDYLVDLVNNGNLPRQVALSYIREEFDLLTERNYRKEYDNYHSKPEQRANRSKRVLARRKMEEDGKVRKGDGKDVDHKDGNPQNNSRDNLRVLNKSKNRSMNEDHGAGFEGTPELLQKLIRDTPYSQQTPILTKSKKYVEDGTKPKK